MGQYKCRNENNKEYLPKPTRYVINSSSVSLDTSMVFSLRLSDWKHRKWVKLDQMDRVKRIWYLSPMRAAKVQASLRIRAVSPEPSLLAHTSSESRGTFKQKARSLAPLNGWTCAVEICHNGMLEDTNSLDGAQIITVARHRSSPESRFDNKTKMFFRAKNKSRKITGPWNIGHCDRILFWGQRSYYTDSFSKSMTFIHQILFKI